LSWTTYTLLTNCLGFHLWDFLKNFVWLYAISLEYIYISNFVFYVPSDMWLSTFGKLKFSIGNNIVFKAITVDNPVIHQLLVSLWPIIQSPQRHLCSTSLCEYLYIWMHYTCVYLCISGGRHCVRVYLWVGKRYSQSHSNSFVSLMSSVSSSIESWLFLEGKRKWRHFRGSRMERVGKLTRTRRGRG